MNKKFRHSIFLLFFGFLSVCTLNTQASTLLLDGGGRNFGPSDPLNLSVGIQHNDAAITIDAYLALVMPDSNILFFSLASPNGLNSHTGSADSATWTPLLSNYALTTGLNTGLLAIFSYNLSGAELSGDYQWILGTTTAGNRTIVDMTDYTFRVVSRNLSSLLGTWNGNWNNDSFSTTGGATLTVENNQAPGSLKVTVDLDGFVGGLFDPDPDTIVATIDGSGNISYSGTVDQLGPMTFTLTSSGQLTINANDIPQVGFKSFTANGTMTNNQMNLTYTVEFSPTGSASGTVTGSK